ncbi:MAG TPA: hypothetical protein VIA62_24045 [Thermoanaerobaculia bacterium]|jgi:hypothetical protein|nr:hypothetical protein [Thermoanaerobaculia bacterium]
MADDTARNADFIGRVVKDAKNPPETRLLTGWLGDAAEEGFRRLYSDAELSSYVDIPTDAILHTEPIRDSQPAGAVFVWIQRDAAVKPGGSASSRAARFLQGQVQQDFASGAEPEPGSIEKAGYRCVTQVPCDEVTGFTGRCTKQPMVGGAWPCITALPHCSEPTGFTGQCTYQPWPNPTQYVGCTIYHCPTRDLTHIQHICNLVVTGMPGCAVVDPLGGGGDPAAKASAEAADAGSGNRAVQPTPPLPATRIPGCGYTQTWGLCPTLPPKCNVSVNIPCITQTETPQCRGIDLAVGGQAGVASQLCATNIACNVTLFCLTRFGPHCFPHPSPFCPVTLDCPFGQVGTPVINPGQVQAGFAAFRAAGPGAVDPGTQAPCSAVDTCPTRIGCDTKLPSVFCTQFPEACPTDPHFCDTCCGPKCQTQPPLCTQCQCTQAGPQCPTPGAVCPTLAPGCPTNVQLDCTLGCTVTVPELVCNNPNLAAARAQAPIGPSAFLGCTQGGPQCPTYPSGDCTFFGCPTNPQAGVAGPGGCTQSGPQCPTHARLCTFAGPACPPTPATVCTQHAVHCPSAVDACPTRLCGGGQQFFGAAAQAVTGVYCQYVTQGCTRFPCHYVTTWRHSCL